LGQLPQASGVPSSDRGLAEAFNTCTPVVTAKLVQDLQNFTFVADSMDDLKFGLQPFIIADGSAEHRQANLEVSRPYGLLTSGENNLMLSNLEALKAKEVSSIPLSYFELERNLGMFGTLLGTVLGNTHALTVACHPFWDLLSRGFCHKVQQTIDTKGYVKPAHILRSIHLICNSWFTKRRNRMTPPTPDFAVILHTMTLNTYLCLCIKWHTQNLQAFPTHATCLLWLHLACPLLLLVLDFCWEHLMECRPSRASSYQRWTPTSAHRQHAEVPGSPT
jgi:hypothetical protein